MYKIVMNLFLRFFLMLWRGFRKISLILRRTIHKAYNNKFLENSDAQKKPLWLNIILHPSETLARRGPIILVIFLLGLEVLGFFAPIERNINASRFIINVGSVNISLYTIFQTILWIVFLMWGSSHITRILEKQLAKFVHLHASTRSLIYKLLQAFIYFIALLIAMNIIGINLTSLAVFSGALGIGIGFGLQKITANLISGFILTFERTLAPGTLVELENGKMGYIRRISVRYTLLETLDGLEILIPNEELVTSKLTHWNLTTPEVRSILKIGVSYDCDLDLASQLILEAANENQKLSKTNLPNVYLSDFGDNAVIFELIYWVQDINKYWRDVRSEILFAIWHKFKQHNIGIPYPQMDLHFMNSSPPENNS